MEEQDVPSNGSSIHSSIHEHKGEIAGKQELGLQFFASTPLKPEGKPIVELELPEKYEEVRELFGSMITSVRLLGLRKTIPTFQKISKQVELLTGRKFLCVHLAQIKYMLPETVQIEKILLHDVETKCMKPELKIQLLFDVVHDHNEVSVFVALSKLLKSRLWGFYHANPEGCDIPEAELPEPFSTKTIPIKESLLSNNFSDMDKLGISASIHLPLLRRHFCAKTSSEKANTDFHVTVNTSSESCEENEVVAPFLSYSSGSNTQATPVKPQTALDNIHVKTPERSTSMRSISPSMFVLTCEDESKKVTSSKSQQSSTNAKKSLDFYSIDEKSGLFSHKEISVHLSDVVFMIHQVFKSVDFRPVTKEELVQKIFMNNLQINDHGEVEALVEQIEKLVPDWLCKNTSLSGDLMYKVRKVANLNSICELADVS